MEDNILIENKLFIKTYYHYTITNYCTAKTIN